MNDSSHGVVSKEVEKLVFQNFQVIDEFEKQLNASKHDFDSSVVETLVGHLDGLLKQVSMT